MANYTEVALTDDIPVGQRKRIEAQGQKITIFNIEGEYFAIYDTCPHKKTAPLVRGTLDGIFIKCPNHGYKFNLKSGKCNISQEFNTKVFPVKIEGEKILLNLE